MGIFSAHRGVSEAAVNALPIKHIRPPKNNHDEESKSECTICKEDFYADREPDSYSIEDEGTWVEARELPCHHIFHDECIRPWLKINASCPVCRFKIEEKQHKEPEQEPVD